LGYVPQQVPLKGGAQTLTDSTGYFLLKQIKPFSKGVLIIKAIGYKDAWVQVTKDQTNIEIQLEAISTELEPIVVSGTLKAVSKANSAIPVELYSPTYFKKNPTPVLFEALAGINGVRPQLNCSVCNTGDIHINGLEGPYTMLLIDGMPLVSALGTVYGFNGIPNSLIERVEIVKGPSSGLYGSEAVAGLINVITKTPQKAPLINVDMMGTSWRELNTDVGFKVKLGSKATLLSGLNYFNYNHPYDKNADGFTDVTLQQRVSVFQKISFQRKKNRTANIAARYLYEDRWGGQMNWSKAFRGSDSIYGESIYTNRLELLGAYVLPLKEKISFSGSFNIHQQNSWYGTTPYMGNQAIAFGQLVWDKKIGKHNLLTAITTRYTFYDDNSTATIDTALLQNKPSIIHMPGFFVQNTIELNNQSTLLVGFRTDYHPIHGSVFTPRLAYRWEPQKGQVIRISAGTGFRVVNLFTEDHAALTGARSVEIVEALKPEQSYNATLNYTTIINCKNALLNIDLTAWYTYFNNQIIPNYDLHPNKIIYANLNGYAVSTGLSINAEYRLPSQFTFNVGFTAMNVFREEMNSQGFKQRIRPVLTEQFTGVWAVSYKFQRYNISIDYTGNLYGTMRLPLVSSLDPRRPNSPVWSIQNLQFTKKVGKLVEYYIGIKNLLNYTPARNNPFIIARSHDPFDKQVQFAPDGSVIATAENPYALTFDPNYIFAPNQGRRWFIGFRLQIN
jgi:outer membrane receptor for ferrienterochelin and colicins